MAELLAAAPGREPAHRISARGRPAHPRLHARRRGRGAVPGRPACRTGRGARSSAGHLRRDRCLVWQVHRLPRCGGRSHGRRRALHRPPPGLGGEPTRVGVPRTRSGRPRRRADRHAAPLASDHLGDRSRGVSGRHRGRLPHRGGALGPSAVVLLHRRRARRGAGVGGLSGMGAPRRPRRLAGHPRRLSRPGRRRPPAIRALLRRARLGGVRG